MLPKKVVWVNPNQLDEVMTEVEQLELAPNNNLNPEAEAINLNLLEIEGIPNRKVVSSAGRTQEFMTTGLRG
ncbi:unnamed protein product [Linum trigynum]|uniref:Uncharacterized protein n=1 Tax=Linum trigynum TaxID=586398 RepID=A0AAV2G4H9_9ROSI